MLYRKLFFSADMLAICWLQCSHMRCKNIFCKLLWIRSAKCLNTVCRSVFSESCWKWSQHGGYFEKRKLHNQILILKMVPFLYLIFFLIILTKDCAPCQTITDWWKESPQCNVSSRVTGAMWYIVRADWEMCPNVTFHSAVFWTLHYIEMQLHACCLKKKKNIHHNLSEQRCLLCFSPCLSALQPAKGHAGVMPGDSLIGNQTQTMRKRRRQQMLKDGKGTWVEKKKRVKTLKNDIDLRWIEKWAWRWVCWREKAINKRLNVLTLGCTEINGNNNVTMHIFISLGRDWRRYCNI